MNITVVEEDLDEISGYLAEFKAREWEYERYRSFSEAYIGLAGATNLPDVIIIDIMLPRGEAVDEQVAKKVDWKRAGLRLIYALRAKPDKDLDLITKNSSLPKEMPSGVREIPILALTKISDKVQGELEGLAGVKVIAKLEGLDVEALPDTVCELKAELMGK